MEEKPSLFLQIVFSIFVLAGFVFFTIIALFYLLIIGGIHYIGLLITIVVLIYLTFLAYTFRFFKTKKRKIGFSIITIIAIAIASISPIKQAYINRLTTVSTEVDVFQYMPFQDDSKVVSLENNASLQLTDNLPTMDGATALYPLYSAIVQATYPEKEYYPYEGEVMVNTTPYAYDNLFNGTVDMIFVAQPSKAQLERAESLGLQLQFTPIGKESFVFFVNKKNAIDGLTLQQIKNIYAGKITNWKEVGGKDKAIRAFQRPEDSGSQSALQALMGDTPIMEAPRENVAGGMGEIINEVAQYRNFDNAIGYTFRYYSTEMVGNDEIKLLEIDGIPPTKETIRSGEYPITSELYIVTAGTDNPNVQKVIDWVLSPEGQQLVEKVGYVPIHSNE